MALSSHLGDFPLRDMVAILPGVESKMELLVPYALHLLSFEQIQTGRHRPPLKTVHVSSTVPVQSCVIAYGSPTFIYKIYIYLIV